MSDMQTVLAQSITPGNKLVKVIMEGEDVLALVLENETAGEYVIPVNSNGGYDPRRPAYTPY